MLDPSSEASKCLANVKKCINALIESGDSCSKETEKLNEVHEAFKVIYQQDKIASLKAVLNHLSELTLEKALLPNWQIFPHETNQMRRLLTDVVQRSIMDCLQKSLTHESNEELLKLREFIEEHADKCKFEVSNTSNVDNVVSILQIAVQVGGSIKLLSRVNQCILPDFDKLSEQRKLDFLRGFAEISPHTTAHVSNQILPSVVGLLEEYMPAKESKFNKQKTSAHLECLLYIVHQLLHKGEDAEAKVKLCERLKGRLKSVKKITKARLDELVVNLHDDNTACLGAEKYDNNDGRLMKYKFLFERRKHNTKSEIRTCINLVAMVEALQSKIPSFMGDNSVKLSWKEAKKPVYGENIDETAKKVPDRPVLLDSLPKDLMESLIETGNCYLSKEWVRNIMGPSRFQQVQQSNPDGPWLLNDTGGVAMLGWQINESVFSEFREKDVGKKGSTGSVRNQMFHYLCWAYSSSDLARGKLEPHKLEKYSPFCTWYMCAFCHPEALGSVPNEPEEEVLGIISKEKEVHHCYGGTIEKGLRHIQKYGIPREVCTIFSCTDHQPPSAEEPNMSKRKITGVRRINTLLEALSELKNQPIGADLLHYTGLHHSGKHIYYGPCSKFRSNLIAYHAVIIEYLEVIDGQLVGVCKMSNGELVGDGGYVYVSLATVYMPIGVSPNKKDSVRNTFEPTHLLTNFRVPIFDDGKIDKNDDTDSSEKEEKMEEDKKENMKDNKKLVEEKPEESAAKRLCTPASRHVKDSGGSTRKRALELVSVLVNDNNVKQLTKALIDYLEVSDEDFKDIIENDEDFKEDHSARGCSNSYMTTKALALVALLKLSTHFPIISNCRRIKDIIVEQKKSLLLEMQQRAIVINSIVDRHTNIRSSLVERMSLLDEATYNAWRAGSLPASFSSMAKPSVSIPNVVVAAPLVVFFLTLLVATKTESNKNYECVESIMAIEDTNSLRVLAINILGRFLSNRDNNIRYVALNKLMKAIAFDDQAVQRHRVTILECAKVLFTPASRHVKDSDGSIRKRALERVSLLVNENNVKQLTKDLSAKVFFIVEKFTPEKIWYFVLMFKVLSEQETLVRVAIWCIEEYGDLLVNNVEMLGIEDPIVVTECDEVDVIEDAITRHNSDMTTKAMALVALLKLASRFPSISERIRDITVKQKGSLLLEMQQRAFGFNYIVNRHKNIRSSLVERMPVLDEATFNVGRAGSLPASVSTMAKPSVSIPNGVAAAPLVDLLDLDSDDILAAPSSSSGAYFLQDLLGADLGSSSAQSGATQAPKAGTDLLLDILSIGTPSTAQNSTSSIDLLSTANINNNPSNALDTLSSPAPPQIATTASTGGMFDLLDGLSPSPSKEATNGPAYPPIVAYESSSLKIEFTFSKPSGNPQTTNVDATFINLSPNTFTDFVFQAAVPKFLQLHLDPASSNTFPASGNIRQNLRVTNSQHGKKSLVMRMRIGYKVNGKDVLEEGQINNFPRGL